MEEKYIIDPELAGLHRELSPSEYEQLELNILNDGQIFDSIKIWGKYVLDGQHRLKIARENDIPYTVQNLEFESKEDAKRWIITDQLGKRNLDKIEVQRLRVELAKLEGSAVAAEEFGVSQRTVQRDLEIDAMKDIMGEDIRKRIENGSLIASRKELKEYGKLTEPQRLAMDATLRKNPSLLFGQAIPRDTVSLSAEAMTAINESPHLTARQKRNLQTGTIYATNKDVSDFESLPPEKKVMAAELLNDPDISDLGDALKTLSVGTKPIPVDDRAKINQTKDKLTKKIEEAMRLTDDLKALCSDKSWHKALMGHLKEALSGVDSCR